VQGFFYLLMNKMRGDSVEMEDPFLPSASLLDYYSVGHDSSTLTELLEHSELADKGSSLGFLELLNTQDFGPSLVDLMSAPSVEPLVHSTQDLETQIQEPNVPATPNSSSISSESNDERAKEVVPDGEEEEEEAEGSKKTKKQLKPKKTSQKRQKEPRFAFMTRSEVDHLEDGYRWRKYGQKAVKNSSFPRSYYRCTTGSCNVKKRVERCFSDPSIVVTTYEGQHTHPSPVMQRSPAAAYSGFSSDPFLPPAQMVLSRHPQRFLFNGSSTAAAFNSAAGTQQLGFCPQSSPLLIDHGLLQDVVPLSVIKEEH
jgi:hypothetical protein